MEPAPDHFVYKAQPTSLITGLNLGAPEHSHQQQGPLVATARCPELSRFTESEGGVIGRPPKELAFSFLILTFDFQAYEV